MLNKVMTLKEASNRWEISNKTLTSAILGQKGYAPRFKEDEVSKSEGTWLITEDAMMRVYGYSPTDRARAIEEYDGIIVDTDWVSDERYIINGKEVSVLDYCDTDTVALYYDGKWHKDEEAKARSLLHEENPSEEYFAEYSEKVQRAFLMIKGLEHFGKLCDRIGEWDNNGKTYLRNSVIAYDYEEKKFVPARDVESCMRVILEPMVDSRYLSQYADAEEIMSVCGTYENTRELKEAVNEVIERLGGEKIGKYDWETLQNYLHQRGLKVKRV